MQDKSLKNKAITIKGKKYILVADRVIYFNQEYPNGSITTELVSQPQDKRVIVKATVIPDIDKPERKFMDYSQAVIGDGYINKTSALENCSTSSIGRALALMGIGVIDSIVSVDEIKKAESIPKYKPALKEEQFHEMLKHIEAGKGNIVKAQMEKYQIKKSYMEILNETLNANITNSMIVKDKSLESKFLEGMGL